MQPSIMGYMAAEEPQHMMGVVIEPVFHHQKGQLYNAQHQAVKSLVEQGLNLDQTFSYTLRPRVMPGMRGRLPTHVVSQCRMIARSMSIVLKIATY